MKGEAMQDMPSMNRRTFVKSTGALGALAAVGGAARLGQRPARRVRRRGAGARAVSTRAGRRRGVAQRGAARARGHGRGVGDVGRRAGGQCQPQRRTSHHCRKFRNT